MEFIRNSVKANAVLKETYTLHLAALASLKGEIYELSNRLQHVGQDRDLLEKQFTKAQLERINLVKTSEDRLDQQSERYEERITELHSVIAELSKKLNHQQANIIREEDEESHTSEIDSRQSQLTSNDNNPNESYSERGTEDTNPELCQLVSELQSSHMTSTMDTSQQTITELSQVINGILPHQNEVNEKSEVLGSTNMKSASTQSLQMYQLHDDIQILRIENKQLRDQLNHQDVEMNHAKTSMSNLRDERDKLRRKNHELQAKLQILQNSQGSLDSNYTINSNASPARSKSPHVNSTTGERTPTSREDPAPITKMAERVKLKKIECGDRQISGSEISSVGISSTKVAEHLVHHLHEESNAQEILQSICSSGSNISESKIKEFEVETERLNSKIDHLKSQNDFLTLTLEEGRTQCDRLSVLIGKYESNSTALQLALNYSDQCLETYDVLVGLLESEQGLLLANCRAAGLGGLGKLQGDEEQDEIAVLLKRANENRKIAESLARHLLQRLDRDSNAIYYGISNNLPNPWDDMSSHNTSTSSTSSGSLDSDFTKGEEQRIREYIHQLKNDRTTVSVTVAQLESIYIDPVTHEHGISVLESQKLDLENAIIMQELMALKEEKAELKAQVYLLEKEKSALELRLNTREAQEQAYRVHIEHLKAELQERDHAIKRLNEYIPNSSKVCNDFADSGLNIDIASILAEVPRDMIEAHQREKKLKIRIQELVSTLEKVTKNSELRHLQSADFVNDLKRANTAIINAFERSKKKHQSKLKKIEQQMLGMIERHNNQVIMNIKILSFTYT
ncbi:Colorectal mutant cancer protein [Nymphon striatum]|nr:Colorectal mutant cancer protein [Nymphon striatum]